MTCEAGRSRRIGRARKRRSRALPAHDRHQTVVDVTDRERNLRRRFGPPAGGVRPPKGKRSRPARLPGRLVAILVAAAVVAGGAVTGFAVTPHDHVAAGCLWWTAGTVGQIGLGQRGCVRGVVTFAGGLAESTDAGSPVLPLAFADPDADRPQLRCPFHPGEAVVVRYHAAFDDGRTFIVVDDCR